MEWIQAVIAQFAYIDDGTFCIWESNRILGILRENVKSAPTTLRAVTRWRSLWIPSVEYGREKPELKIREAPPAQRGSQSRHRRRAHRPRYERRSARAERR